MLGIFRCGRRGTATVELGLCLPLLVMLIGGGFDFGMAVYLRLQLEAAASAATNYAIVNAARVNAANGASLANSLAQIVSNDVGGTLASAAVVVNGGPAVTISGGAAVASGTASNADACYCPTGTAGDLTWGAAATCGTTCASGLVAGKFVTVQIQQSYRPIFSGYGFAANGAISTAAIVQVQ